MFLKAPLSFEIETTINALPTARATYPAAWCCDLADGTLVTLPCDDCNVTTWRVQEIEIVKDDEGRMVAQLSLAAEAEDLRRCAVSSEAVFENLTVQDVINNLVTYVQQEIGLAIAITYVNLSTFDFTSKFNPQSKNVIEILREAAALSGNSFRFDGLTVEFGTFGNASGYVFREGFSHSGWDKTKFFQTATYRNDSSEVVGCLYVEGGSYTAPGEQTAILKLGSLNPAWIVTPPAGYTVTQVTRLGLVDWRLCLTGGNGLSARINVPGITPDVEAGVIPSAAQQLAAAEALLSAAIEYMKAHSQPVVTWEIDLPGCLCGLRVGDKAHVLATCDGTNEMSFDPLYVTALVVSWRDSKANTHITLSSRLDDEDHSLDRTFGKGLLDRQNPPITRSGGKVVEANIPAGGPVCGGLNSSSATVNYGTTYASPPLIQATADQGIVSLSSVTTTNVVVCVDTTPTPYPPGGVNVTLVISGISA